MCMYTYVEGHDWNGKKIIPFCTHEGSGSGRTDRTLKNLMKGAEIQRALAIRGSVAQNNTKSAEREIDKWLKNLGF